MYINSCLDYLFKYMYVKNITQETLDYYYYILTPLQEKKEVKNEEISSFKY